MGRGVFNLTDLGYLDELNELADLTDLSTPVISRILKFSYPSHLSYGIINPY